MIRFAVIEQGFIQRACAMICAWLVFMMPVMSASNTQALADMGVPAQQSQIAEEEEHKTCVPVRPLVELHDGAGCYRTAAVPYAERAFIAHHGEVAVPPPKGK